MRARVLALLTPLALVLLARPSALALNINEEYKPQNEFKLDPWINIQIGGIDLSINKAVFYVHGRVHAHDRDDDPDGAEDGRRPRAARAACRRSSRATTA